MIENYEKNFNARFLLVLDTSVLKISISKLINLCMHKRRTRRHELPEITSTYNIQHDHTYTSMNVTTQSLIIND